MSMEPVRQHEISATSMDARIYWLSEEMGYSRDKDASTDMARMTEGYEEKLVRLGREPSEDRSVYGFLSNQWHRFRMKDTDLAELESQTAANLALQLHAKSVAGLCDKVALSLWMDAQAEGHEIDPEQIIQDTLTLVRERATEVEKVYQPDILQTFNRREYGATPMGMAVLAMHTAYFEGGERPQDMIRETAIEGAAAGMAMLREYGLMLEDQGYSSDLPKPGLSSGNIEPWIEPASQEVASGELLINHHRLLEDSGVIDHYTSILGQNAILDAAFFASKGEDFAAQQALYDEALDGEGLVFAKVEPQSRVDYDGTIATYSLSQIGPNGEERLGAILPMAIRLQDGTVRPAYYGQDSLGITQAELVARLAAERDASTEKSEG